MTHWLGFSEADFDATQAPRGAARRAAETADQAGLFFVATPVKAPRAAQAVELPGQVSIFDEDAAGPMEDDAGPGLIPVCKPNDFGLCRTCGRDMQTDTEGN